MWLQILLIILAIWVFIGIIRVILTPSEDLGDFIFNLFLLDFLGDFFSAILDALGDMDWSD